ncbi:MAG TPA: AIPR family protein [Gemmataceae bacterium]|nr:AIPR family protein [Gemmataceae bacterium]
MRTLSASMSPKSIRFSIDKEHFRRIEVEPGVTIYHLYPTLNAWVGREAPDDVNPRSHEDQALSGPLPKEIEQTIRDNAEDFYLANRGETILAESVSFQPEKQVVEIILTDYSGDAARHGVADGGTTDGVIARVQKEVADGYGIEYRKLSADQIPTYLGKARVHLEVIVGLEDRERIGRLVQGRNKSKMVKSWTIEDFKGSFDWIKEILEAANSQFKGKIGYEENAAAPVNILEVLAILTLFHPMYDSKGKAPTVAYSSKGRIDKRFTDENAAPGYRMLAPILREILELHDYVYANFQDKYKEAFPGGKLGRRGKTEDRLFPKATKPLPLTGIMPERQVPSGVLYPLLASLRALVRFPKVGEKSEAAWRIAPRDFFDKYGEELMENLFSQLEVFQSDPQKMGKAKTAYTALHNQALLLVADAERGVNGD